MKAKTGEEVTKNRPSAGVAGNTLAEEYKVIIQHRSKVSWQSVASLDSRFLQESSIENREPFIENPEPVIENRELLIENRVEDRVSRVWKQRFSHDWFLDFTLSEQNKQQPATPVLRERIYASKREKSLLIGEKCILKYFLLYTCKCLLQMPKNIYIYSLMFAFSTIWNRSGKTHRKRPHECCASGCFLQSETRAN